MDLPPRHPEDTLDALEQELAQLLAAGAELDLLAFLTSRYFGVLHYGAVFGGIYAFFTVGSGLAPLLYARTYDALGTYRPIMTVAAGCLVVAILLLLSLGRYPASGADDGSARR